MRTPHNGVNLWKANKQSTCFLSSTSQVQRRRTSTYLKVSHFQTEKETWGFEKPTPPPFPRYHRIQNTGTCSLGKVIVWGSIRWYPPEGRTGVCMYTQQLNISMYISVYTNTHKRVNTYSTVHTSNMRHFETSPYFPHSSCTSGCSSSSTSPGPTMFYRGKKEETLE